LWASKEGYRRSTIEGSVRALRSIARQVDLLDTQRTLTYLAKLVVSESRKEKLATDLQRFYEFKRIPFTPPRYRRVQRLPFIPLESEIDAVISGCGKKTACFLQLIKETGIRPGEAWNLRWVDIDTERTSVNVLPEKDSNPRQLKIGSRLLGMLNTQPKKYSYVFRNPAVDSVSHLHRFREVYRKQRKRISAKLQNPRLDQITFKTLRHWKATNEYHKTKDILHVMQLLGHKNIQNTLVYTHLVNWESDEYVSKVAKTVKEAQELVEAGFDYMCDVEGYKVFRKRK
jgi:integrase